MNYRKLNSNDCNRLAEVHLEAFGNFFLASLGKSFLKTYYKSSLKNEDCIGVCAYSDEGNIVGFAIGTVLSKGFHKKLLINNLFDFSLRALIILLTNPKAIVRLSQNLDKAKNKSDDGQYAELLSICVLKSLKGSGTGKQLIEIFEQELIKKGCKQVVLTTDFFNNDDVISFYKKQGYNIYYEFVTYPNRKMFKMIKTI